MWIWWSRLTEVPSLERFQGERYTHHRSEHKFTFLAKFCINIFLAWQLQFTWPIYLNCVKTCCLHVKSTSICPSINMSVEIYIYILTKLIWCEASQPHLKFALFLSGSIQILIIKLWIFFKERIFGFLPGTISSLTTCWKYCKCQTVMVSWEYTKQLPIYSERKGWNWINLKSIDSEGITLS